MKKRRRRLRRRQREALRVLIPAGAAVIAIIVLAVVLVVRNSKETSAGAETVQDQAETGAMPETEMSEPTEETDIPDGTEPSEEDSVKEVSETEPVQNMAAEVGSMDDAEDPQSSSNMEGGARTEADVDVSKAAAWENETAEATLGIDVSKEIWAHRLGAGKGFGRGFCNGPGRLPRQNDRNFIRRPGSTL